MKKFGKLFVSLICVVVSVVLITQLYGCGTLIYPERRGQTGGTVDAGVAIMDGLWVFAFIIPGCSLPLQSTSRRVPSISPVGRSVPPAPARLKR